MYLYCMYNNTHFRSSRDKAVVSTRGIVAFIISLQKMAKSTLIQCVHLEGSHSESKCLSPLLKDP